MKLLDCLPITDDRASLRFGDRFVTVRPDQILVWVSVSMAGPLEPEKSLPKFPALLDTGNNFGFSMRHRHLHEWAGIDPRLLTALGDFSIEGKLVKRRRAAVWLYPNLPGRQEVAADGQPFRLKMPRGVAVYAPDADPPGPRLPLLGLPALLDNDLDFWLDPERRHVTVQPRSLRRSLMRLLCRSWLHQRAISLGHLIRPAGGASPVPAR